MYSLKIPFTRLTNKMYMHVTKDKKKCYNSKWKNKKIILSKTLYCTVLSSWTTKFYFFSKIYFLKYISASPAWLRHDKFR